MVCWLIMTWLGVFHLQRRGDGDATTKRARHRAGIGVKTEDPLGSFPLRLLDLQVVGDVDPADDKHLSVQFDITSCLRV